MGQDPHLRLIHQPGRQWWVVFRIAAAHRRVGMVRLMVTMAIAGVAVEVGYPVEDFGLEVL